MPVSFSTMESDWSDRPCVVVGGGPSLKGFPLDVLKRHGRTIGANKAALVGHTDVLCSIDVHFIRQSRDEIQSFVNGGGEAYLVVANEDAVDAPVKGAHYIRRSRDKGILWSRRELNGVHSGYTSIALAASQGATDIMVVGVDMSFKDQSHWHGGYSWHQHKSARSFERWAHEFARASEDLKQRNVRVVFYTTKFTTPSIAQYFPTLPLESII